MHSIYIVEDDESISELVAYALNGSGFTATVCGDSVALFKTLEGAVPDLILLDIMLPDEDGLSILKRLKGSSRFNSIPIIMLTAKGSELDKIKGLDGGADDYVTKPFSVMELTSRIHAVLRRSKKTAKKLLVFGTISLDTEKHIVSVDNKPVALTLKEYELLLYLIENPEIALSRDKIISTVWEYDYESESRTIDAHVKALRQKLGEAGGLIQTVRGVGYKLAEISVETVGKIKEQIL